MEEKVLGNKGLVSIIVPIYNVELYLERCLCSIVNQTYSNLEIILVEDGSPDNCSAICDEWEKKDSRIKVIHKHNEGLGYARNSGLDIASGEYVAFIDSDDYVKEDHIEKMIIQMDLHHADLVVGGLIKKSFGGYQEDNPITDVIEVVQKEDIIERILLPILGSEPTFASDVEREMSVCINLYKKSVIDQFKIRFFSERDYVSEDVFFNMLYFLHIKKAVLIPDCMYYYLYNTVSLTHTYRADRFDKYSQMFIKQRQILEDNGIFCLAKNRLHRTYLMKVKKSIALIVESTLPIRKKIEECRAILNNHLLQEIAKEYSENRAITIKQHFFVTCIRKRYSIILLAMYFYKRNHKR